jgi:hypothetical protein
MGPTRIEARSTGWEFTAGLDRRETLSNGFLESLL